ncbi:magnesium or manganese-dependent protein phosphatase [Streptomyces glaucescens]|uniref:Magnesium or manganese-dependent protein phosphatase n=2 Tax=Streptomyces glaucescens TaxID=1907 RepID=A0A089XC76_STRGA|nr:magnesium or manganese-dependent protein phosphatase [Streptomyces glaucescens]
MRDARPRVSLGPMESVTARDGRGGGRRLRERYPQAARRAVPYRQQVLRVRGRSVAWVPPLVLLAVIALADVNTGADFRIVSWIVLVPGIAAAICGVWGTAVFAVLSVVTYVAVDSLWPDAYQAGLPDFILVTVGGVLATLACVVRVRGQERVLRMQNTADTIRATVLRPLPPGWGGLEHAAVYLPADVEARVGGDFYDIQPGPHGTRVLLGDVQGKGLGAVEMAAALLGTFREAGYHEPELRTVAERLETRVRRHRQHIADMGRGGQDTDRFATAVLLGFPPDTPDAVDLVSFGHEPPLVAGPCGVRVLPPGDGLPLGLGELMTAGAAPPAPPAVRRFPLAAGETLLLTTDGVTEARDGAGAFYPLATAVTRALAADPAAAVPRRLVALVRDGVLRHSRGRLEDDTTMFAVRRGDGGGL